MSKAKVNITLKLTSNQYELQTNIVDASNHTAVAFMARYTPRAYINRRSLLRGQDKSNNLLSSMFVIAWANRKLIDAVFLRRKVSLIVKSSITVNPLSVTLASHPI
jgi:hypothetical protein